MGNWRDIKRAALGDVHATFSIPAVYLTHAAGSPVPVTVRLHQRPAVLANQGDDWSNTGQLLDIVDRIIFHESDVAEVLRNAYVIFSDTEAYRTGPSRPKRDGYTVVECSDVAQADLVTLLNSADTTRDEWKVIPPWSQQ